MGIEITSSAFNEEEMIPSKYTCDGEDISPPLEWSGIPGGTQSIALISDDPDAPMGTWVHWVIYNIPAVSKGLAEDVPKDKILSDGSHQGVNDFGTYGYGGPCPPGGMHRYYFKIYALDKALDLETGATKSRLEKAMTGHIIAKDELMGKYKRQ